MKRIVFFSLMLSFLMSSMSCESQNKKAPKATTTVSNKIEVYYFHYTRRCITCNAVEDVTKKTLAELYPEQQKKHTIVFASVNLDDATSKAVAEKCQAEGQGLILLANGKRIDLTDKGFMYAKSKPEKLKEELKKAIDNLL